MDNDRPFRMPVRFREEMWDSIEKRLDSKKDALVLPAEISREFNYVLHSEFGKERRANGATFELSPIFTGIYLIDPQNPAQTRVHSGQGTEACSPIPLKRGIIGRAVRTGQNQYVPNVLNDPDHVACDSEMAGTEIVLLTWSDPYKNGPYAGREVPLAALDIDLNVEDAFSREDVARLTRIWEAYGAKRIFPGEPAFEITPDVRNLYEFLRG